MQDFKLIAALAADAVKTFMCGLKNAIFGLMKAIFGLMDAVLGLMKAIFGLMDAVLGFIMLLIIIVATTLRLIPVIVQQLGETEVILFHVNLLIVVSEYVQKGVSPVTLAQVVTYSILYAIIKALMIAVFALLKWSANYILAYVKRLVTSPAFKHGLSLFVLAIVIALLFITNFPRRPQPASV